MENQPLSLSKMVFPHIINENIILEEVMATHHPDTKDFKTSFIFNFVKKILCPTMIGDSIHEGEEESNEEEFDTDEEPDKEEFDKDKEYDEEQPKDMKLPYQIKQLSFEMSLKCPNSVNPHSTAIYFLKMLSTYSWEAKLLMVLAAFSLNFGEFSLVHSHKGLAGKLAILKGSESQVVPVATQFLESVLHLTKCIVELAQSSSHNSSTIIPIACYWIITSVLAHASYFTCLTSVHSRWFIAKETQLFSLRAKINEVICDCRPILEKKREEDCCKALWHAFFDDNSIPSTNLDVLKLVFKGGKNKPIYDGKSGEMVGLRWLKNRNLLLLISSSLDIDNHLPLLLQDIRWRINLSVLWIPILDCPESWAIKHMEKQYRRLVNRGELLSVRNVPKSIAPGFVRFVKEKLLPTFQIGGEPIIISLDHNGRVVHHNAMHMVLMRGYDITARMSGGVKIGDSIPLLQNMLKERTLAVRDLVADIDKKIEETAAKMDSIMTEWLQGIREKIQDPVYSNIFTSEREKHLWNTDTWCTKFLIGTADPQSNWVDEGNYIFLIGGNDLKWVQAFISKIMLVMSLNPQLTIMTSYFGSNVKVGRVLRRDRICEALRTPFDSWFFWARCRSIFLSRIMFLYETHCDEDYDEIVAGLKKLLAYEAKDLAGDGWAMLCKGNKIIVCDLRDKMLTVMNEYEKWKKSSTTIDFDQAFKDHYEMLYSTSTSQSHPYFALEYPSNFDKVPESLKCPQYCHNMQKFVTFRCCHDEVDDDNGN